MRWVNGVVVFQRHALSIHGTRIFYRVGHMQRRERDTQIYRKKKIQGAHSWCINIHQVAISSFAHVFRLSPLFTLSMLYSKKLLSLLLGLRLQGSTSFVLNSHRPSSSAITKRTTSALCIYQHNFAKSNSHSSNASALFATCSDSSSSNNMSDEVAAAKAAAAEYKSSDADGE